MSYEEMKKAVKLLAVMIIQLELVIYAYKIRNYFAVGGEWLIIPLMLLIKFFVEGCIKDFKARKLRRGASLPEKINNA